MCLLPETRRGGGRPVSRKIGAPLAIRGKIKLSSNSDSSEIEEVCSEVEEV